MTINGTGGWIGRGVWAGMLAAILAGCAAPRVPQQETYGKIVDQVGNASETVSRPSRAAEAATKEINAALLPPMQIEAPRAPRVAEQRFDLSVTNAPATQVFMALVSGSRYSMLLPPDLSGSITVSLKDVSVREALESLRDLYGYDFRVQGTRITIIPNTLQTRLFQISYLASKRGGTSSTRVSTSGVAAGAGGASGNTAGASNLGGSTGMGQQGAAAQGGVMNESASVFTGVLNDFWFDLSQALATVLACEFDISRASGSSAAMNILAGQLMGQRIDKLKCPEGRSYLVNSQSGVVMVRGMPSELREVERLLKVLQANIERQVMIEAKIVEVELKDEFRTGINWAAFDKNGGHRMSINGNTTNYAFPGGEPLSAVSSQTDANGNPVIYSATLAGLTNGVVKQFAVPGALGLAFQTGNFASLINFLQTQGNVYVMSNPRIATLNNQKAVIKVGTDDYYITAVTPPTQNASTSGNTVSAPTITAQPFFSGIALDVTPQIDDTGTITLHIRPSVTDVSERDKTINFGQFGQYTVPYASTKVKESDSIVRVRDGMIVAIGGLMSEGQSNSGNKVPGAGDLPVAGNLFKQTERSTLKRELVILLKPTLIQEDIDWRQDLQDTQDRLREYDPARIRQLPDIFSKP
ncbi:MAG: pilus (MSHA type) biogenesis protein MshL [Azonexus sp.]|nr:pilus (MSHA type) biogenesis protein MshL [Azonexus sp.]MCK6411093.1 pilus (MSHA type) biogenesis protein MshL [Azonexus sp.]